MRIALIHALKVSIPPIEEAFSRLWPEAQLANLLDDSLATDLARAGSLTVRHDGDSLAGNQRPFVFECVIGFGQGEIRGRRVYNLSVFSLQKTGGDIRFSK